MAALVQVYEHQQSSEYGKLLTQDFRYSFSSASDPTLVTQYGPNWGMSDETISADHLFNGFTSQPAGQYLPGASNIAMTLNSVQYLDDSQHPDSSVYYKWVTVARAIVSIEIPGTTEPQIFLIDARHDYYLVRGDAAVLSAGQLATNDQWYIRRWEDLTTPLSGAPGLRSASRPVPNSLGNWSWGALRAMYR
jgi:hypothetical protein